MVFPCVCLPGVLLFCFYWLLFKALVLGYLYNFILVISLFSLFAFSGVVLLFPVQILSSW